MPKLFLNVFVCVCVCVCLRVCVCVCVCIRSFAAKTSNLCGTLNFKAWILIDSGV